MQAGILAVAGIICRIIGLLYGSPLTGIIGDEGNGYYSQAYNCYTIILLISSYSIPSAISKVIAQKLGVGEYRNAQRIFHCALIYVIIVGGAASLLLFCGAGLFVEGNSVPVLRVFAPTIFFFGLLGVLRGYFQAHKTMVQTSISQILEQLCNAIVSLSAAYLLMQSVSGQSQTTKAIYGAMGSAIGTGSGVVTALLFMWLMYHINRKTVLERAEKDTHPKDSYRTIFKTIILIVTPFIMSTFIYNFTTMLDQTIYTKVMIYGRGFLEKDVLTGYGIFSRKAVVISNIPIALATAMSAAMMPSIASSYAQGQKKETAQLVNKVIRMTMMIAIPSAVGLIALAKPVMMMLFPQRASLDQAAFLLAGMGITVIFYSLSTVTNAVLQGIGKVNAPVVNAAVSLCIQAALLCVLLFTTDIGSFGLVVATIVYSFLMCMFNQMSVNRNLEVNQDVRKTYLMPLLASAVMGIAAWAAYQGAHFVFMMAMGDGYFANFLAAAVALCIAAFVYAAVLIRTKGVTEEELGSFPRGSKIVALVKKIHLL